MKLRHIMGAVTLATIAFKIGMYCAPEYKKPVEDRELTIENCYELAQEKTFEGAKDLGNRVKESYECITNPCKQEYK